jgi:ABC-type Mn2+/Zn2+ transport system ATPase subunit
MSVILPLRAVSAPDAEPPAIRPPAIRLSGVHLHYNRACVLHDLHLEIPPGKLVAITGPNGAGKTSLLKLLTGQLPLQSGEVAVEQVLATNLAYLPQNPSIQRDFPITVTELVAMGLYGQKLSPAQQQQKIAQALAEMDLSTKSAQMMGSLSAGQLKRALLARILVQDALFWCLDEPFAELDDASAKRVLALLRRLSNAGKTILVVLHQENLLADNFDMVLGLTQQKVTILSQNFNYSART